MRSKIATLHPLLVLLAVAMASVLFVAACGGGGEATQAPEAAEEAQVPEAAEEEEVPEAVEEEEDEVAGLEGEEIAGRAEVAEVAEEEELVQAPEAAEEGEAKYGGTLTMGIFADFRTLDPPILWADSDIVLSQQVYDNLLMIQQDLSVKPELATSWEANEDNSSWTFHLRKGVNFYYAEDGEIIEGKEFTAEDVVFTFTRLVDPVLDSPVRATFEVIKDMVIIDDHTVRFDLNGPNAFFPSYFSVYQARILPSDVDIERLTLETFGTGPFVLVDFDPGVRATMVRNPNYWEEGKPYLDELVLLMIAEPATRAEALKSGDIDLIFNLEVQSVADLESHPETMVLAKAALSWVGLVMDVRFPPFDNKLVRQAFQAATDRDFMRQAAFLGLGANANDHPIPPNDPLFAPQYKPPEYDIELAKQLLEQAGYPDGIDVDLYTSDAGAGMTDMAVAFRETAAPAGIRVNIQRVSSDLYWDEYWMVKNFSMTRWFGRANPDQALSIQYHSEAAWNAPRYKNKELDALMEKARGQDLEGQKESYAEIQRMLVDDVPRIIPAFTPWLYGARKDVRNADPHPLGWGLIQDAWLDD